MQAIRTTQRTSTPNSFGGHDYWLADGGILRTTTEDGEQSIIRLNRVGVHHYTIRFDANTPEPVIAAAFDAALNA